MKKSRLLTPFIALMLLSACAGSPSSLSSTLQSPPAQVNEGHVGSFYKDNYLWSGAMNLAWTDLSQSILKAPVALDTENSIALEMAKAFNEPVFMKQDLDEASYYIKSGYGQETVKQINKESREKFPEKSFTDLDSKLASKDIIAYAYLLKQVEYLEPFQVKDIKFKGEKVKGLEAKDTRNVQVMEHWNDDHFLIQLSLKDPADELILAKGFSM